MVEEDVCECLNDVYTADLKDDIFTLWFNIDKFLICTYWLRLTFLLQDMTETIIETRLEF